MSKTTTPPKQPKGPGAPRTASNDLPIYDSIAACSGATGIPVAVLKAAKKAGCPAFISTRVHLGPFLRWDYGRDIDDGINWGERNKRQQALRGELALEREKKEVIARASVQSGLGEIMAIMFGELDRYLCAEQPSAAVGKSQIAIKNMNAEENRKIKIKLQSVFEKIGKGEN